MPTCLLGLLRSCRPMLLLRGPLGRLLKCWLGTRRLTRAPRCLQEEEREGEEEQEQEEWKQEQKEKEKVRPLPRLPSRLPGLLLSHLLKCLPGLLLG